MMPLMKGKLTQTSRQTPMVKRLLLILFIPLALVACLASGFPYQLASLIPTLPAFQQSKTGQSFASPGESAFSMDSALAVYPVALPEPTATSQPAALLGPMEPITPTSAIPPTGAAGSTFSLPAPTASPVLTPTENAPTPLPPGTNPLTGLVVADPDLLERRPLGIKVTLFPRDARPQWGLSFADLAFEYYLEHGLTRFFAVFYGNDADKVGPVRSARFFDENLVRMYKSVFVFANADRRVMDPLLESDLLDYLIVERSDNCPPMCRNKYEQGYNNLFTNTQALSQYVSETRKLENERPDLSGMHFSLIPPPGGIPGDTLTTIYSTSSYNRWQYEPDSNRYLRFQETGDHEGETETFTPLTDRLTGDQIAADNVVALMVPHDYYSKTPEIVTMQLWGFGSAYAYRDGRVYKIFWNRATETSVLTLYNPDGTRFALKPGVTFFQVIGQTSKVWQFGKDWRFEFQIP
jgi:hypothetical protein